MGTQDTIALEDIRQAQRRIAPHVQWTPLKELEDERLWLKCENRQTTGSFKLRGALNKVLRLSDQAAEKGVLAASAGNHGQGVAYAARLRGIQATIVVPAEAVEVKVEAIRALGARVITVRGGYAAAEAAALEMVSRESATWISPYNDVDVIAGQGTIGLEIAEAIARSESAARGVVYVPASGGGLLLGVGLALKSLAPDMRVVGVQPSACAYLYAHLRGDDMALVEERATIADGLSGAVEPGAITLRLLPDVVDEVILVEEQPIRDAVRWAASIGEIIEPSAAVAVAGAWEHAAAGLRLVILSGGNIDPDVLETLARGG